MELGREKIMQMLIHKQQLYLMWDLAGAIIKQIVSKAKEHSKLDTILSSLLRHSSPFQRAFNLQT